MISKSMRLAQHRARFKSWAHALRRRLGARVNEHHRAIREMDNQVNQHIEIPQIQYSDKVVDESVVVQRQVSPRTTETK